MLVAASSIAPLSPQRIAALVGEAQGEGSTNGGGKENRPPHVIVTPRASKGQCSDDESADLKALSLTDDDLSEEEAEEDKYRQRAIGQLTKFGSNARLQLPPRRPLSNLGSSVNNIDPPLKGRKQSASGQLRPTDTCKILVVGNPKCGKTSLIRRFVNNRFLPEYTSTIGADYCKKDLMVRGSCVRMQLWDIAGQERTRTLTRAYFRRARGAVVVCDVSRPRTFEAIEAWKAELDSWCSDGADGTTEGMKLPTFLLANKCDLLEDAQDSLLSGAILEKACRDLGFTGW
jgi:small GTP-binding protein